MQRYDTQSVIFLAIEISASNGIQLEEWWTLGLHHLLYDVRITKFIMWTFQYKPYITKLTNFVLQTLYYFILQSEVAREYYWCLRYLSTCWCSMWVSSSGLHCLRIPPCRLYALQLEEVPIAFGKLNFREYFLRLSNRRVLRCKLRAQVGNLKELTTLLFKVWRLSLASQLRRGS